MRNHRSFFRLFQGDITMMDRVTYDQTLEEVIQTMNVYRGYPFPNEFSLWGHALYLPMFLMDQKTADTLIMEQILKHWVVEGKTVRLDHLFDHLTITADMITDDIKKQIIRFSQENTVIQYQDFLNIVQIDMSPSFRIPELFRIYRVKVGDKVFIQIIEGSSAILSYALFSKKLYSVLMQVPYNQLDNVQQIASLLENSMKHAYPHHSNRTIRLMERNNL